MWLSTVLLLASLIIAQVVDWHVNYLHLVFLVLLGVGYGGFQANIIQFGIDQLTDASSDEIVAYIYWYSWSFISSGAVEPLASECTSQQLNQTLTPFLLCLCLSILVILLFLFNNVLIKEPLTTNPFRLIHNVLKYASKTKHPRLLKERLHLLRR